MALDQLDRTRKPNPKPTPSLSLPVFQRAELKNGLNILLAEHHGLPLVQFQLVTQTGSSSDPAGKSGLVSFVTDMMDEGTGSRSALKISDDLEFIGARLGLSASHDASFASLLTLKEHLVSAVELLSDVILHPSFPPSDFERVKKDVLTSILQRKDQPTVVASNVFSAMVYGPAHPYGRTLSGTESSVAAFTNADIREWYESYYRPNNSTMIVVGDVELSMVESVLERTFGDWILKEVQKTSVPPAAQPTSTQIYLIDKPKAAQSQVRIGHIGAHRTTPDYFSLLVMNTILGGQFTSRINLNLREEKGYTYGARSDFVLRKAPGTFVVSGGFHTDVTDRSIEELIKELRRIRSGDVTEEELTFAKTSLVQRLPAQFETPGAIAARLSEVVVYELSDDYYASYVEHLQGVTLDDVNRVAEEYVHPNSFTTVVVGDAAKVRGGLEKLGCGPVELRDESGEAVLGD